MVGVAVSTVLDILGAGSYIIDDRLIGFIDTATTLAYDEVVGIAPGEGEGEGEGEITPGAMVSIPAGSFQMGDPWAEGGSDELPVHTVTLSAYQIGKYEVTNQEYADALNWANGHGYLTTASCGTAMIDNRGTLPGDNRGTLPILLVLAGPARCFPSGILVMAMGSTGAIAMTRSESAAEGFVQVLKALRNGTGFQNPKDGEANRWETSLCKAHV